MSNPLRTNQELLQENTALKQKIRELEQSAALQKQLEEELRCSWQQLRLLIDAGPDFFFLKDLQFRYQLVNSANARFFGRDEAAILGRTDFELMPEEAALACRESDEQAIRDRTLVVTIEPIGDRFYETHKFPLLVDGEVVGVAGIVRDITDRRQAEEALRKSEKLQNTILSHVGAHIYLKDKQGRYTYVNNRVCELFGMKEDEIIGKDDTSFFSAASIEEIRKSDLRVLEYGETINREEIDLTSVDKVPRSYWVVKMPLKDSSGNIFGLCGISTDITDLKRTGEALRESEERFRLLCESSQDAILMMDHEGRVSYWNPAAERMFGYTSVEAVGRDLHELIMPERFREAYLAAYPEFVRTGRGEAIGRTLEMQAMRKDGSEITIALSLSAEWIKDGWNALGILRDITEQKEGKEALKQSESRLASIIEFLPDATFAIDLEGKVISWNRALEELTGFSEEEMLGRGNYEYAIPFYGERRPLFVDLLLSWDDEIARKYSFIKKKGDTVYAEAEVHFTRRPSRMMWGKASLLRNERGEVIGAIETMRDVTDRKLLESQLLQAQKMEAIGTLAGGVAHDFNNILMGIEGYVSLMLQEIDPRHPHHERLQYIEEQVQSASDLTRQLLGFASVGRYEIQPTDLNQLIRKSSTMFSRTRKELTLVRKYEKNLWTVEVDRGQIKQALLNLYLNVRVATITEGAVAS